MDYISLQNKSTIGPGNKLVLIAGPCVLETEEIARKTAGSLQEMTKRLGIPFVFKASFDKANRTSLGSFRGPGLKKGLEVLAAIKNPWTIITKRVAANRIFRLNCIG